MILYIVVVLIFVILAFMLLKLDHHTRKIKLVVLLVLAVLLYFSITGVFSSKSVDLGSPKGIVNGIYVYFGWLGHTVVNLWDIGVDTVRTVGNAVKVNSTEESLKR
jgi:hypothetical protein